LAYLSGHPGEHGWFGKDDREPPLGFGERDKAIRTKK
jgi:hypothetical protein